MVFNICLEVLTRAVLEIWNLVSNNIGSFILLLALVLLASKIIRSRLILFAILVGLPQLFKLILDYFSFGFLGTLLVGLIGAGAYALIFAFIALTSPGNIALRILSIPGAIIIGELTLFTPFIGIIGSIIFAILMALSPRLGQLISIGIAVLLFMVPTIATTACKVANLALGGSFSGIGTAILFLLPLALLKQKSS